MSDTTGTAGKRRSKRAGIKAATHPAAANGRYPLTPLEEDLLRLDIVRRLTALRCTRCTKQRCRRAQPCRRLADIDRAIAAAQPKLAAQTAARNANPTASCSGGPPGTSRRA